MVLPVKNIVNVTINMQQKAAQGRNFGSMLIVGTSAVIPATERIREYSSIEDIATDFGTSAPEYQAAQVYFSQSPQPSSVYIGLWNKGATTPETLAQAVTALLDYNNWYGLAVTDSVALANSDLQAAAQLIEASSNSRIMAITTQDATTLQTKSTTDLAYLLSQLKLKRTFIQYSSSNQYAAISAFARGFTVNFNAQNSVITLKFKQEPGISPENLTSSQAQTLAAKNCNVYAQYDNNTAILQEGVMSSGDYFDEIQGLDWLQNQVETAVYNLLYQSSTKIPHTDAGVTSIINTVSQVLSSAVNNGLLAQGKWTGAPIGKIATGDVLTNGYYVYADPVASQTQADIDARKSPPIQCAVKLAGAIHFVDTIINVVR